jgi:curli biogenesis system outer membrane secretion channel CsgG
MKEHSQKPRRHLAPLVGLALVAVLAAGCSARKRAVYLNEEANFGAVQRVALMPFDNFTNDDHAPEKVSQILMIELLSAQVFEVVDPGESRAAIAAEQVSSISQLSAEHIRRIGETLNAEALMLGTVQELSMDRSSGVAAPTISLQFRLVDTLTGETIWSSIVSRQGAGASARLFGVGGTSVNEAIRELVREALGTLIK